MSKGRIFWRLVCGMNWLRSFDLRGLVPGGKIDSVQWFVISWLNREILRGSLGLSIIPAVWDLLENWVLLAASPAAQHRVFWEVKYVPWSLSAVSGMPKGIRSDLLEPYILTLIHAEICVTLISILGCEQRGSQSSLSWTEGTTFRQ